MDRLTQYTTEILEFKRNLGQNAWLIGSRLIDLKDSKLYLEKYGMWTEYLEKELDFSERSAQRFMRVAGNFTSADVVAWGVHKLDLLLSVEEPIRKEIIEIHTLSDSVREMQRTVQAIKAKDQNIEVDYFFDTESVLRDLLQRAQNANNHLKGCHFKPSFKTYVRRGTIVSLWKQIQEETHGNYE